MSCPTLSRAMAAGLALAGMLTCRETTTPPGPRVARLEVVAAESALLVGHTLQLGVIAWDSGGDLITPGGLVWRSGDPTLVSVDSTGLIQGVAGGDAEVYVAAPPSPTVGVLRLHVAVHGEVKWRLSLGPMPVDAGVSEGADGTLYMLADANGNDMATLFAISPRGVVKWQRRLAQVQYNYPVVAADGSIVVVGQFVYVFAPDGTLRWALTTRPTSGPGNGPGSHAAAVGADGTFYAAMGFDLLAFRVATGDTVWVGPQSARNGWLLPPAIAADGRTVYVKHTAESTFAFDAGTGAVRWAAPDSYSVLAAFGVGPTVGDGLLRIPLAEQLLEVDTMGTERGVGSALGYGVSEPAIGPDGTLYLQAPQNDGLYAFRPAAVEQWRLPGHRSRWPWYGGPALAQGGVLYVAALDGFYALQLSPGGATRRWRFPAAATDSLEFVGAPLIGADGTVYSFTSCGFGTETLPCSDELFAFWEDRPVEPNSPWPMWRHDARRSGQAHR